MGRYCIPIWERVLSRASLLRHWSVTPSAYSMNFCARRQWILLNVSWSLADQRHFLQTISGEADRLAQLVSNLLDLSRQEAGLLLLRRVPVNLQELVAKISDRLSHPRIKITAQIPEDLPLINIDSA